MSSKLGGKISGLFILVLSLSLWVFSPLVSAESGNVGGKPAHPDPSNPRTSTIFIKTVEPGETTEDGVQVINNTDTTKTIQVYAVDSVKSSGGAFACAQAADPLVDAGSWVKLASSSVTLASGQKIIVDFKIVAPDNASPGEHNACIVLQEKTDASVQAGIGLNFRTAIRVAVLVPGDIIKKIVPSSISAEVKAKNVAVSAKVKSESNVSLDTNVKVNLRSLIYGRAQTQDNTFPVLRGEEAEWNFEFKRPFWGGFYKANFSASYNADTSLGLGESGNGKLTEIMGPSKNVFIWPQPVALIVELFVLVVVLFVLILIPKKLLGRRSVKKKWVERRVHAGETITEIAQEVGVRWKRLAKVNKIKAPYNLVIGSFIRVPATKSTGSVTPPSSSVDAQPEVYTPPVVKEETVDEKEVSVDTENVKEKDPVKDLPGKDEPNILKEPDSQETVEDIFEDDDIPQEEIAKEIAAAKKIKVKKKPKPRSRHEK